MQNHVSSSKKMHISEFLKAFAVGEERRLKLCTLVAGVTDIAKRSNCLALAIGGSLIDLNSHLPADIDCAILISSEIDRKQIESYVQPCSGFFDLFFCSTIDQYTVATGLFEMARGSDEIRRFIEIPLGNGEGVERSSASMFLRYLPTSHLDSIYNSSTIKLNLKNKDNESENHKDNNGKVGLELPDISKIVKKLSSFSDNQREGKKIFLCYAAEHYHSVCLLYEKLKKRGHDPWMDKKNLLAGQSRAEEIKSAIESCDLIVACISKEFSTKRGYLQKEVKLALEALELIPVGQIFLIPARLEDCMIPKNLTSFHPVDLFEEQGFENLCRAIDNT